MPYSYRDRQAGNKKTRGVLECQTTCAVGTHPQAAGVRPLSAHASRERGGDVPDMSRTGAADGAGLPGEFAQHGLVRELSHRPIESSSQGAIRLRGMPLLMRSAIGDE